MEQRKVETIHSSFFWVLLIFTHIPSVAFSLPLSNFQSYMALDYVQRTLSMQDNYGKGNFTNKLPQGNLTLGLKLNDFIGVEVGYSTSPMKTRTSLTGPGDSYLGVTMDPPIPGVSLGEFVVYENKIQLRGVRLSLMGYFPLEAGFYGIGNAGATLLQLKAIVKPIANQSDYHLPVGESELGTRHFSSKKLISVLMGGIGYQFSETFGVRVLVGYEITSRFKNIAPKEKSDVRISLRNNTLCSIGITTRF